VVHAAFVQTDLPTTPQLKLDLFKALGNTNQQENTSVKRNEQSDGKEKTG